MCLEVVITLWDSQTTVIVLILYMSLFPWCVNLHDHLTIHEKMNKKPSPGESMKIILLFMLLPRPAATSSVGQVSTYENPLLIVIFNQVDTYTNF